MQTHHESIGYSGDGALSRQSSFNYTPSMGFANEFSGLLPPGHNGALPPSPSFPYPVNYGRDNQHSLLCPTASLLNNSSGLQQNHGHTDTMPYDLALHALLLPYINLDQNSSGLSEAAPHCSAAWSSSVAAPFFKVTKSHAITAECDSAEFVRKITDQVKDMEQTTTNQSAVQPKRPPTLHHNEKQQTKVKSSTSSIASSSVVGKEQSKKNRPKRALTAYNLFFKEQREQILGDFCRSLHAEHSHHRIGFEEMGRLIGQRWQKLDRHLRRRYEARAQADKGRYKEELAEYLANERNEREAKFASLQASVSEDAKHRYFSSGK